jgi:YD repeat-containing protein
MKRSFSFSLRLIAFCITLIFGWNQIVWAGEILPREYQPNPNQPVVAITSVSTNSSNPTVQPSTTIDFLTNKQGPLSSATQDIAETVPQAIASPDTTHYEYERYDFQEALDLLRLEFASAVIVKEISAEDLKKLAELPFETGVIVLHGEIVLFTSGSADEIGVLPAAKELAGKANLISHTHSSIYSNEGPSGEDINEAIAAPGEEYVITHTGVYAYDNKGILNNSNLYGYDQFLSKFKEALEASKTEQDQIEARKDLNQFVEAQDEYNRAQEDERETFRMGGTLSYASGLTSANVTALPGSPYPYVTTGSSVATKLSYSISTLKFSFVYSVPGTTDSSGFTVSFDNATTPEIESCDISLLEDLVFGLKGPDTSLSFEVVDINNIKDTFTLTGISNNSERFWKIPVAAIAKTLDKAKIKSMNFIVTQANTTSTTRTGTLVIRSYGLNTDVPSAPVVTTGFPAVTKETSITISGTKEANTSILINGVEMVAPNSSTTWSATKNLTVEGNNTLSITSKNSIGLVSLATSITIKRDTVIPTGSLNINSSAATTASPNVTLNLSAADAGSGIDKMSFSTDNVNWTAPEAYATTQTFALPVADGPQTVYVKYYDKVGNASNVYSKSIILDTTVPAGSIDINSGALYTVSTSVTLNLSAGDSGSGIGKMSFSTDNVTWTTAQTYNATKSWTFSSGDGNKTVYVKYYNKAGNVSAVYSKSIQLDTTKPAGTININDGATYTSSPTVTLNLSATDAGSGIDKMSFSEDNANWTTAETYATTQTFTFSAGDGRKTVYVKYYDKAGKASSVYSKSIVLDTLPPTGIVTINSGAQYIKQTAVTLNLSAADAGSGLSQMSFSSDNVTWTAAQTYSASKSWTFASGDGNKTVYAKFMDKFGKWSSPVSVTVLLDTVKPTGTIDINSGAAYTNSENVTLNLLESDSGSGIGAMSFSVDNMTWTAAETYATSKAFTLSTDDGHKTVYAKFFDKAGNASLVYSSAITLDTIPPAIIVTSTVPNLTKNPTLIVDYTADGVVKQKAFTLAEGDNIGLAITEVDAAGNIQKVTLAKVVLDTIAPVIVVTSTVPTLTKSPTLVVNYTADDVVKQKIFTFLEGDNTGLTITESDAAGNSQTITLPKVVLDTVPPAVVITSSVPSLTNQPVLVVDYSVDGVAKQKTFTLAEGDNTGLTITEADAAGNIRTITLAKVVLDTVPPVIVVTSQIPSLTNQAALVVDYTADGIVKQQIFTLAEGDNDALTITEVDAAMNTRTVLLSKVMLDTVPPAIVIDPATPSLTNTNTFTISYTADGTSKLKTFTGLTEGENTLAVTETDLAGNITTLTHSVTYTPSTNTTFPVLEFRSPQIVTTSNYELVYAVDGTEKREIYALQEGANLLTIEEPNASGKVTAHYLVVLNAITDPVFPAKETELIFNLNGTDATLVNPSFDASGLIQGGWIKSKNGTAYRLSGGLLSEEFRPDSTHIYYDSLGRIHSKIDKNGKITNYQYKVNSAGNLLSTHIEEGNDQVDLDSNGLALFWKKGDGTEFSFDSGRLTKIKKDAGEYPYHLRQVGSEWISESINPLPADSSYPASLHYTSDLALSQTVMPDGTIYQFDLSGAVTRVVDSTGKETLYDPEKDLFGAFHSFSVTRDGITRVYGEQGKLTQLKDADGTVFTIDQDKVVTIQKPDGTLYRDLAYDATGNLQNALVKLPDGRELVIANQQLTQIKAVDGTILEIQNDRPARSLTADGRVYQYHESTDANGNPVFIGDLTEFINDKGNHVFVANGRVNGMEETRNGVLIKTGFTYDGSGRIIEAVIDQDGVRTARFVYDYQTSGTVVTNDVRSIRYYDSAGKLMKLTTPRGEEYSFSQITDPSGAVTFLQILVKVVSQLEGTINYQNGKPVRIVRPDSIEIKNIVLNLGGSLLSAVLVYPSGAEGLIEAGELKQIIETDGTKKEYAAGLLQKITLPTFEAMNFSYTFDGSGNVTTVTVQDGLGSRTYTAAGVLSSAVDPSGDIFTYDVSGNLIKVKTNANEEFNYSGQTLSSIKFSTGEMLTGIVLDTNGNLASGTYDPKDGSLWTIAGGAISQIRDVSGNTLYYSGGHVTQIVKTNGDRITYSPSGQITQITWADGSRARQITTNSQDALVNAIIYSPSFDSAVLSSALAGIGSNERPLVNGSLQTPGPQVRTAGKFFDFNGLYWREVNSTTLHGSNQNYIRIKMTGSNVTVKFYSSSSISSLFNQQTYQSVAGSPYVYIPLPDLSTNYIYAIEISPKANATVDITDTPLACSSANYQPVAWVNTATSFVNQKTAPGFPARIGVALSKKSALESSSQNFTAAENFNSSKVSDGQFQITSLKNGVLQARLSPDTVLSAVYDRNMNLLSAVHSDPAFDPSVDVNGAWKKSVSGWEDAGFEFAPAVTTPSGDVPLKIEYTSNGGNATVSFQNASQAIYQNDRIETIITPEGKAVHYSYAAGSSDVNRVIFDPDQIDPETTEVKYEYGKIREIRKAGVLIYLYSYEFNEIGDEITVIEDTVENQIRRFLKGKLISINNINSGFQTAYDYDGSGRIAKAVTFRSGRIFGSFAYAYSGDDTLITEEATGISRRYGADGFLKELITAKGEYYKYSVLSDGQAEDLLLQELVKIVDSRGTIEYSREKPVEIITTDGTVIKNLIVQSFVDENHITQMVIQRAEVHLPVPDGRVALIENGKVFYMSSPGGEIQEFENGFLERLINAQSEITDLIYTRNASGEIESIGVEDKNGQRIYDKNGLLIRAVLPDTTQIDYDANGRLLRLQTPGGEIWEYSSGSLSSVTLTGGGGKIEQIVLDAAGNAQSCIYTKDGIVTTLQNGVVTSKKTLDGTLFFYGPSGKVSEIRKPVGAGCDRLIYDANGVLTAVERADGSRARQITVDSQDNLVNAIIYAPLFNGAVLNAALPGIGSKERPLVNGVLQAPGTQVGTANEFFDFNGDYWRSVNSIPLHGANQNYLRIKMTGSNFTVSFYATNFTNSLFSQQTYQSAVGSPYVYIPLPDLSVKYLYAIEISPKGNVAMDITDAPLVFSSGDMPAIDWTGIAIAFKDQKDRPEVPSIINETLLKKAALETQAAAQFSLRSPDQLDEGQAQTLYNSTLGIVKGAVLDPETIIAAAYRASDSKLLMAARANNTVAHYVDDQIDYVTDLDGNLLIDHEYDASGDLIAVHLIDARKELEEQIIAAQTQVSRQETEALMTLAVERGYAIEAIQNKLNEGLAAINAERERIRQLSSQKVCHTILFFKSCENVQVDVSAPLSELDRMEKDLREQTVGALAGLDTVVAQKKMEIETDAKTAFVELEKQQLVTYREILKQELSPVLFHHYRKILGRDPSEDEINAWIEREIGDDQVSLFSLEKVVEARGLNFTGVWMNFDQLKALSGLSQEGVLAFLKDVGFVMVTDVSGGNVTFVQRSLGNRTQELKIELVPWLDANGVPIPDAGGNIIYIERYVFVPKDDGFGGEKVTVTESEFLSRWLKENSLQGAVFTDQPLAPGSVLITADEAKAISGLFSWDILVEYFKSAFGIDPERANVPKLAGELSGSEEYSARLEQVNAIKAAVRDFLEQYLASDEAERSAKIRSLGLALDEVISVTAPEIETILAWLDSRDLHFGHSAFFAIQQLIEEGNVHATLFDIAREAILIDIMIGVIHPLTTGDLELSLFALNRVAENRNVLLTPAKVTFDELKREVALGKGVLVHMNGNHYVVVTKIELAAQIDENGDPVLDEQGAPVMIEVVTYIEKNVGPSGEAQTLARSEFEKIWMVTVEGEGIALTPTQVSNNAKIMTGRETQQITGAFFGFIFGILKKIFDTVIQVVKAVFEAVKTVLRYVVDLVVDVVRSLTDFVLELGKSLVSFGQFFFEAVRFVGAILSGDLNGGFQSLQRAVGHFGNFLFFAAAGGFLGLAPLQVIGFQVLSIALSKGTGIVLDKIGIKSPVIKNLIGSFITGGVFGFAGGQIGLGTTFLNSAVANLAMSGVNELALHIGLPPPIATNLGILASIITGSVEGGASLPEAFKTVAPDLMKELTLSGVWALGNALGIDPRLTSLISLPLGAGVGVGFDSLFHANTINFTSLSAAIKNGFAAGAKSIGFDFGGATSNPIFGSLLSGNILSSIGSAVGSGSLFSSILDILKMAVFTPFNAVNSIIQTALQGVRDFASLIQEKSLAGALESMVTSIFSRQTIEKLLSFGGIGGFIGSAAKIPATLNGQSVLEQKLDGTASLFYDLAGNFIGKKENGVTQLGTFGFDAAGKWALLSGTFISNVVADWAFAGEVSNGQLKRGKLYQNGALMGEFEPENNDGTIIIDGSHPDAQQFDSSPSFWNMVFKFLPMAMDFVFKNGLLQQVNTQVNTGNGASQNDSGDLYALANGIDNDSGGVPAYITNLEYDLFQKSNQTIVPREDTLPIELYHSTIGDDVVDGGIDILKWVLESQSGSFHSLLVIDVMRQLASNVQAMVRPIVGMGFSGGLLPLVEGLATEFYNVKSLVGLGAATLSLASSELLNVVLSLIDFAQSSIGKVLGWLTGALNAMLKSLLGKLHLDVLNVGHLADEFVDLVSRGSSLAIDKLREIISVLPKVPAWNFPTLANRGAETFVNIYGTKDILYQTGIAGYRDSLFGFSVDGVIGPNGEITRQLFNIEIVGAEHLYYMKRNDLSDPGWNTTVSDFVTRLMLKADSTEELSYFLTWPPLEYDGCFSYENNRWVIRLPGWQTREQT